MKTYAGVMWALMEPTVILVAQYTPPPADHIKIIRELYRKELYLEELLTVAREWREELEIRRYFCDPAAPEIVTRLRRAGLPATAAPKEQDLARYLVKQRLVNTREGKPGGMTISRGCVHTIPELLRYHLPEGRSRTAETDTHSIRALHCLVLGLSQEAVTRVRWL